MRFVFTTITLAAVLWLGAAARAADAPIVDAPYEPPEFLAKPPALPPGYDESRALRLDLPQALMIAMQRNLNLSLQRKNLRSSDLSAEAAHAEYEPTVTVNVNHNGAGSDGVDLSANQKLPTGATVSLGMNNQRSAPSGPGAAPGYSSSLNLSITQPLLRGFSTDLVIPRYAIITAKIANEQARHQLRGSAAALVAETESDYWNVVAALYSYGVATKSEAAAEEMLEITRRQIAVGMTAASEITGAENDVAERKVAVLSAAAAVEQAWDGLRLVLNLAREDWDRPILPTDRPRFQPTVVASADAALQTALRRRPEMANAALATELTVLALRKAENERLPQIDLSLTGSSSGLGTTYHDALSGLGRRDSAGWSVMVGLSWTPLQRASMIAVQQARLARELDTMNREQQVQSIWSQVRAAVRQQRAAALQVVAASRSRKLAAQSLEVEIRKYKTGSTSNLDVTTRRDRLAGAELSELQSLIGHEQAAAQLLLATGELLEKRHIVLELANKP